MQVIIMTSDGKEKILTGFFSQWKQHVEKDTESFEIVVCGFSKPGNLFKNFEVPYEFYSIGKYKDYPAQKWSNALYQVLNEAADDVFLLMLEDYWLLRPVDITGLKMMYGYMKVYDYVLKFDVTNERLWADGGHKHIFGNDNYNYLGYLDIIKSNFRSAYHMSLWSGFWNRENLKKVLIPNETAQQIELEGTTRLQAFGDDLLVLSSRQAPLMHANVIQSSKWNTAQNVGVTSFSPADQLRLRDIGALTWKA